MQSQKHRGQSPKLKPRQKIDGVVKRHPDGYGFLIPDNTEYPDVYISKHSMDGIMTNDRVRVEVRPEGDRYRGDVTEVLSRAVLKVTGQLHIKSSGRGVLVDESGAWGEDLKVTWSPQIQVKDGDWVLVKITTYPDSIRGFQGEVLSVLGDLSDPKNDNHRTLIASNIPFEFSRKAVQIAESYPKDVTAGDKAGRTDLTNLKLITIDGKTAKDFDDAVYVEKSKQGFRLIVGIADVSHYVKPGSALDEEAYERGTSTYFPGFVAPMLPEALSNELCSLKPNVERLSFVCEMQISFDGDLTNFRFYEAVIRSHARVTYGEAQEVIDGHTPESLRHVEKQIRMAGELAEILMRRRFRNGSLNLEIPETTIEVDSGGHPVDILRAERLFAHRLIEELMLITNVATAKFLHQHNIPGLYRVHEEPKPEAIETLEAFLGGFGHHRQFGKKNLQKRLTEMLEEFKGKPQEVVLSILTLRSMNQAKYSPENIGHFGLNFDFYAHFTSPIRRYPDLVVHRLIKSMVTKGKGYRKESFEDLQTAGTFLSACEQRSVKAERLIQGIKKARFMQKFVGQEFDGVISSVTKFGLFVLLRQFDVDGLLRVEELGKEHFDFDEDTMRLVARRSGHSYNLGDPIRIQVVNSDYQTGRIDFGLASGEEMKHANSEAKAQRPQKRKSSKKDSQRLRKTRVSRSSGKDKPGSRGSRKAGSRRHK